MGFKGRHKPRGKLGVVQFGTNPSYKPLSLPTNKPEIERFMLASALAWARIVSKDLYGLVKPPVQNLENDFDFTLYTRNGKQFLDLMEAAPLECFGNSYESVPNVVNAGEFADRVQSDQA